MLLNRLNLKKGNRSKMKRAPKSDSAVSVLRRLGISQEVWLELVNRFEQLFYTVAGTLDSVDARRTRDGTHRHKAKRQARQARQARQLLKA